MILLSDYIRIWTAAEAAFAARSSAATYGIDSSMGLWGTRGANAEGTFGIGAGDGLAALAEDDLLGLGQIKEIGADFGEG